MGCIRPSGLTTGLEDVLPKIMTRGRGEGKERIDVSVISPDIQIKLRAGHVGTSNSVS